jgi:membrane-associated phospholipid phosphatase
VTQFTSCLPALESGETPPVTTLTDRQPRLGVPERLGTKLEPMHPVGATLAVAVLGYLALVGFALALGAFVTHVVVHGGMGRGDLDVARWFAERRTPVRNDLSLVGSYLAETVTVLVVVAIALVVLAVKRHWPLFGLVVVSLTLEGGVYVAATYVISRNRPGVPRLEDLIVADSFPSGHTAAAVAMYGSLAIVVWAETRNQGWRTLALVLAVLGPIIVATSRVYRGMHNPTDVICGALIGIGCIAVGSLAVRTGASVARAKLAEGDDADPAPQRQRVGREVVGS